MPNREGWTTMNEIGFIMNAGTGKFTHPDFVPRPRIAILEGYLDSIEGNWAYLRDEWGSIDKEAVVSTARGLLETLKGVL